MLGSLTLGRDGTDDFPARRGCHRPRSSGILYPKRLGRLPPLDGDTRTCTTEPEETKHPVLQRRYLDTERSSVRGWQDLRAMRDSRGPCSEKGPFLARSSRGVSSDGDLRGISDAWRAYLAKASSFRMHGVQILPKPAHFGCMACKSCREGAIFPSEAPFGIHGVKNLPRIDAWGRTARAFCHCQSGQERIRAQSRHRRTPGERISRAFCHRQAPGERIFATSCQQSGIFVRAGLLPCHSSRTA